MRCATGMAMVIALLVISFGMAAPAMAVVIDFESFTTEQNIENLDLGGVALSISGLSFVKVVDVSAVGSPLSNQGIEKSTNSSSDPFAGQFSGSFAGNVNFVSVDLGGFAGEVSLNIFLKAFDSADTLLASASDSIIPGGSSKGKTLSVMATGIDRIEFGGMTPCLPII